MEYANWAHWLFDLWCRFGEESGALPVDAHSTPVHVCIPDTTGHHRERRQAADSQRNLPVVSEYLCLFPQECRHLEGRFFYSNEGFFMHVLFFFEHFPPLLGAHECSTYFSFLLRMLSVIISACTNASPGWRMSRVPFGRWTRKSSSRDAHNEFPGKKEHFF